MFHWKNREHLGLERLKSSQAFGPVLRRTRHQLDSYLDGLDSTLNELKFELQKVVSYKLTI